MIAASILPTIISVAICALPCAALGESRLISWAERADWQMVGTIQRRGIVALSNCTGTLVAPDLVLTAAHCVPHPTAAADVLARATFVAGWNRDGYAAYSGLAAVYLHPDHAPGRLRVSNIHKDAALVRLATPITGVVPMPLGQMPGADVPLALVGYENKRRHAPTFAYNCAQTDPAALISTIDCAVSGGQSGSPLLALTDAGPRLVGVVSAQVPDGAMAARLQDWMRDYLPTFP